MQYLKLLYILVLIAQFVSISGVMKWFNFKKDDKDDKEDCEPEIVAIRKTKVLPIAVPVFKSKRTYSVKTKKSRRKHEDDEEGTERDKKVASNDTEQDDEKSEDVEEKTGLRTDQPTVVRPENDLSNDKPASERSTNSDKRTIDNLKPRSDQSTTNEQAKPIDRDELDESDEIENMDYETDELIKNAIEDDDEDIEEFISNDDL